MGTTQSAHNDQHTDVAAAPARRVMLVTYHFPPDRRVGAVRWQRFVPFLVAAGYQVDVLALDPSYLTAKELDAASAFPPSDSTRVFGVGHPRLMWQDLQVALARRVRRLLRGGAASAAPTATDGQGTTTHSDAPVFDARPRTAMQRLIARGKVEYLIGIYRMWERRWAHDVARRGLELLREQPYVAVISSGPPHTAHRAAARIAAAARIPHLVDLRDPWSGGTRVDEYADSRLSHWQEARAEARVLAAASAIVTCTPAMGALYRETYPALASRVHTVMNGADDEPLPPTNHGSRFLIVYAGNIYIDRDPTPLFRALDRVVRELGLTPDDIGIELVGEVERFQGRAVREIARECGVDAFVTLSPSRPRRDVLALYARAQMLVNLPQDSMTQIPAKTFEYVRFASWVLVFTPTGSATDTLLRGSGADVVGLDDVDGAADALRRHVLEHRAGVTPTPLNADERYSRSTQAAELVARLDAVTGARARA